MVKNQWENYKADTPDFWRKIGDTLLVAALSGGTYASTVDYKYTGIVLFTMGIVGKLLTTFFKK